MSKEPKVFTLQEVHTVEGRQSLADFLESYRQAPIALDGAHIEKVDSLAAQLLLVAQKAWEADGREFEIRNLNESAIGDLQMLGLYDQFTNTKAEM